MSNLTDKKIPQTDILTFSEIENKEDINQIIRDYNEAKYALRLAYLAQKKRFNEKTYNDIPF